MRKKFYGGNLLDGFTKRAKAFFVEVELKEDKEGRPCFSASGVCRGYAYGQCLEDCMEHAQLLKPVFVEILDLWRKYHLNYCHAGTEAQERAIKEWQEQGNRYNYDDVCKYLESKNLLVDNGHKYGTAWLYREIPAKDLARIKALFE